MMLGHAEMHGTSRFTVPYPKPQHGDAPPTANPAWLAVQSNGRQSEFAMGTKGDTNGSKWGVWWRPQMTTNVECGGGHKIRPGGPDSEFLTYVVLIYTCFL